MPLKLDPNFARAIKDLPPPRESPPVGDVATRRINVADGLGKLLLQMHTSDDIETEVFEIKMDNGSTVAVHRFFSKPTKAPTEAASGPAVLHIHGGGYISMDVDMWSPALKSQVSQTSIQIFSVCYSLAPEAPYPTALEECYATLLWLQMNAEKYNIDPSRIAVQGESAGGGLAAAVSLLARDRKLSPPIAKQILIYPMLDDRNVSANGNLEPFATWSLSDNITAWTAYLGTEPGSNTTSYYAAPARATELSGLPITYMDMGELDIFRDENLSYASRLAAANISLELHVYPGVPHAFEFIAPHSYHAQNAMANRWKALSAL
ncbi:hypothetical protein B0A52_06611 [Exophiala mesophila]|uniref:Alpha/beta hydrolase fold-3 domain-containing protein n=1 Tax=Exophiala mesophila TaxID=212818 RepID=A0A438N1H4_EXOME|nr:hypothetical protein B0A52_06611 [Exophiala mesophila]